MEHTCKTFVFIEEPASFTAVPSSGSAGQLGVFVPAPAPPPPNYLNAESVESKWKRRQQVLENLTKGRVGYQDSVESLCCLFPTHFGIYAYLCGLS